MLPDEMYKRRHYGTPQSFMLIVTNFATFAVAISIFGSEKTLHWFFWVVMAVLALYNYFNIRKDREEYNRFRIIAYVASIVLMAIMFVAIRLKA